MSALAQVAAPRLADERGGVIAIVAVSLPLLVVLVSFVVDIANWYEHKRHLQLQADAGALAASLSYASTCVDDPILVAARRYAGDPLASGPYSPVSTPPYNTQLSPGGSVRVLLNSPAFFGQTGAGDLLDGLPCATKFVDVKVTETGLPLFFGLGTLPAINARARVQLQELESTGGSLPLAVPDTSPSELAVLVVDETTGALLAAQKLERGEEMSLNGSMLTQWDNVGLDPLTATVPATAKAVGIVVAASGDPAWKADSDVPGIDDVDDICSQPDVRCYYRPDATTAPRGLVHLRVVLGDTDPPAGLPTAPVARRVGVVPLSCPDVSGPSYVVRGNCTFRVRAKLDFGATFDPSDASVKLKNDDLGCTGVNGCVLTYNATGADAGFWTTPSDSSGGKKVPTIPTNEGPLSIGLDWETSVAAGKGKKTTTAGVLANVQRVVSVNSLAEPIEFVRVFKDGVQLSGLGGDATISAGTVSLTVAVGVRPSLSYTTQTQMLRVASTSGSQTQTLACDGPGAKSVLDAIAKGCSTPYQVNDRALACIPAVAPKDCVPVKTGDLTWPQMRDALDARFAPGGKCSLNKWPADNKPDFGANDSDPRIVNLIITTFGAFENQGAANDAPVTSFGAFYVTGWGGSICSGDKSPPGQNEKYPLGCTAKQASTCGQGDIWGHFFKYIGSFPTGTGSGSACSFMTLGPCVPVLTD